MDRRERAQAGGTGAPNELLIKLSTRYYTYNVGRAGPVGLPAQRPISRNAIYPTLSRASVPSLIVSYNMKFRRVNSAAHHLILHYIMTRYNDPLNVTVL